VFQHARKAVRALMQKVVYEEFLPALIGNNALPPYVGYSVNADPRISTEFSTSAYRFGHSMVNEQLLRLSAMDVNSPSSAGPLLLVDAFFTPEHIEGSGSVDELVRGLIMQPAEAIDMEVADVLRNNLFGEQDDLLARNIQRGRDHHQMTYMEARRHYNLRTPRRFSDISNDNDIANRVADAHQFDINAVELFVGGLAEAPFGDSQLGELFTNILADQFERLRDGDRHFYRAFEFPNAPSLGKTQAEINDARTIYNRFVRNAGFADILLRNTNVEAGPWMEGNPFLL
jgi:peroxidase